MTNAAGKTLKLIGLPLPKQRHGEIALSAHAQSVVFAFDPIGAPPPATIIASLYGLTPAETRLMEALLSGLSLNQYADQAGIARTTVKTHLAGLFHKTDTRRQSDLIRVLGQFRAIKNGVLDR